MRFINLEQIRPRIGAEIARLEEAQQAVNDAADAAARADLFERYRGRWVALRSEFAKASHQKCWYVECYNPGCDDDVDHFRPKGSVREAPGHPGYYWLAFTWTNLRLSCHFANRPKKDETTRVTGGKHDHFPLIDPSARALGPADDYRRETPELLDPTCEADVSMLSFDVDGSIAVAARWRRDAVARRKVEWSRLGLNLDYFVFKNDRRAVYDAVEKHVTRGTKAAPAPVDGFDASPVADLPDPLRHPVEDLLTLTAPDRAYSAAARVYVRSFRHVWWVERIVLKHMV